MGVFAAAIGTIDQPLPVSFIHISVASGFALDDWQLDDSQIKDHCFNGLMDLFVILLRFAEKSKGGNKIVLAK